MNGSDERTALAAFFAMSVLAGGNAVAIRFSNRELDPLWGACLRFALAALLLAALMAILRVRPPQGRALTGAMLYGAFGIGGAFALAYYGLVDIHAGLGQTVLALVPLATLFLVVVQRQERLRLSGVIGGLTALAGIAVMSGATVRDDVPALSLLARRQRAVLAQAAVLVRRFPPVHPVAMNAVGMGTGAALLSQVRCWRETRSSYRGKRRHGSRSPISCPSGQSSSSCSISWCSGTGKPHERPTSSCSSPS